MYIALEGTKGTGKSTLFQQLESALKCDGVEFQTFSPTKPMPIDIWWEQAYAQHADNDAYVDALYTARANHHAQLADFNAPLILGDRSILTSFVTRWPNDPSKIESYIKQVRSMEYAVPIPDLVIYLDLPVDVTLNRLAQRQRNYGLFDEQIERLIDTKLAYEAFFKLKNELGFNELKFQYFDAQQNSDELFTQVYAVFKKLMENKYIFQ